ncbi:MAG: ABC transporter permease [Eubacterium sp.]|jgi:simple sugar transport system permease protein|nr:ABC transporter permease [Eubacterium sp.]
MKIAKKIFSHHLFFPLICLFLVLILNLISTPTFFEITIQNGVFYGYIIDIINRSSELVVLAAGMTLVVASSGGTDISVGAVSAIAGACCIFALGWDIDTYNVPYFVGFFIAMAAGAICGAWNGFLVAKLRIQPMVATLILFTAGRGIAQLITSGQNRYVRVDSFRWLGNFLPGSPVPTPVIAAAIVILLTSLVLRYTALGTYIQSVGINRQSSRIVGLQSTKIIFFCYMFCGLCSGIAGMIMTSRIYSIDANNVGNLVELDAILAVALGGNSLGGGKFRISGSVIGAVTIQALSTSLYAMKITADQLPIYKAIMVIIIVALQSPEFKSFIASIRKNKFPPAEIQPKINKEEPAL